MGGARGRWAGGRSEPSPLAAARPAGRAAADRPGPRAGANGGDEVAEVLAAADVATLADHQAQPCGGECWELGQGLQGEGPEHIDSAGPQGGRRHWRAVAGKTAPHGIKVHMQLAGDAAHAPLLPPSSAPYRARRARQAYRLEGPPPCPPSSASGTVAVRAVVAAQAGCTPWPRQPATFAATEHPATTAYRQGSQAGAPRSAERGAHVIDGASHDESKNRSRVLTAE